MRWNPWIRAAIVAGVLVFVCAVAIATTLSLVVHHESSAISRQAANREYLVLDARFAGHAPLVDASHLAAVAGAAQPRAPIHFLHTVIFDTRGAQRLVRLDVPYWFARLFAWHAGRLRWLGELTWMDDTEFDSQPIDLSPEQIERHGPGLIVQYRHAGGGWFVTWAE